MPALHDDASEAHTDKIVCACFKVTESTIVDAVELWNMTTVKELCRFTNAGAGCTACRLRLKQYLQPNTVPQTCHVAVH